MSNQKDRPSWLRRSVTHSVTPHMVRIPHLRLAAALRCHLRTATGTTNRHKLCRWHFSVFLVQKPPHSSFRQISCKQRETYIKISTKRLLDTINLRKKYLKYRETMVYHFTVPIRGLQIYSNSYTKSVKREQTMATPIKDKKKETPPKPSFCSGPKIGSFLPLNSISTV